MINRIQRVLTERIFLPATLCVSHWLVNKSPHPRALTTDDWLPGTATRVSLKVRFIPEKGQ